MITYRLPENHHEELQLFAQRVNKHLNGEISDAELKAHRVPFGIYEQRKKGTYMVRIRCAAGIITPLQLLKVAELAERYGSGRLHVTTRQELQIHDVELSDVIPILEALAEVHLSTRGGGGNTVRNITVSWDAGISETEPFDVTPYAVELTSRLIERSDSWRLPRKYKIAFSNSAEDNAFATVNDLGFIARKHNGENGFTVYVAGGLGRRPRAGYRLHEFIPADEVFIVAEAIKQLFLKYGNHRNRHAARLRFLWNSLGHEQFVILYENEKRLLKEHVTAPFAIPTPSDALVDIRTVDAAYDTEEIAKWKQRYVTELPKKGLVSVRIPVLFGDVRVDAVKELARFCRALGDDVIRFTQNQNIHLRNIPSHLLGRLYDELHLVFPLTDMPAFFGNAVTCTGADTCQLGICLSRNALTATLKRLENDIINLDELSDLRLHFSGCPNSCGQHPVADIGFFGRASRNDGIMYPAYSFVAGAEFDRKTGTRLANIVGEIPAKYIPDFIREFLGRYFERKSLYDNWRFYIRQEKRAFIKMFTESHITVPDINEDKDFYRDWGVAQLFSLKERGTGECSAGLVDLLETNMEYIRKLRSRIECESDTPADSELLSELLTGSAHALLVTQGVSIDRGPDAVAKFQQLFGSMNLLPEHFKSLLDDFRNAPAMKTIQKDPVTDFSRYIEELYRTMDDSLQFHPEEDMSYTGSNDTEKIDIAYEMDLKGVPCPMNFIKTKFALAKIRDGSVLRILLDDGDPSDNVPQSVKKEGHQILRKKAIGDHWIIDIRKGVND